MDYGINVRKAGAAGDGSSDDSEPIQRALNERPSLITAPAGLYRIGETLRIFSGTRLIAHPQARFVLADGAGRDPESFLLTNHDRISAREIHIDGGIWDGNNAANPRGPDRPGAYTGVAVNFQGVCGLTLRNLTVRDPESFNIRMCQVSDFTLEHITFEATRLRPNQDGIHINGHCHNGLIRNVRASGANVTNDDLIAFNADDAMELAPNLGMVSGPITNIAVHDIRADSCHSFVRILSIDEAVEDIQITAISGGCHLSVINMDATRDCTPDCQLLPPGTDGTRVGAVARVSVRDVEIHKVRGHQPHDNLKPLLDFRTNVTDISVDNFRRTSNDGVPEAATLSIRDIARSDLVLEGIERDVVNPESAPGGMSLSPMASVYDRDVVRLYGVLGARQALTLQRGGISRLKLSRAP